MGDPGNDGYDELRRSIVAGELLPGEHLIEEELSERLGVGRSAVRLALVRLEHDGLVVRERHRGARVRRLSEREAVQILEARAVLEGLAARCAALTGEEALVGRLRDALALLERERERGDAIAMARSDTAFHRIILEASGHEVAAQLAELLIAQTVGVQYRTILLPGRADRSRGEHERIVEAIAARDGDAAEETMRAHLRATAAGLEAHAGADADGAPAVAIPAAGG